MNWDLFIEQLNTDILYIAIGSAMGHYQHLETCDRKNQQYPPFISKLDCRKTILLIDPHLEEQLEIERFMIKYDNPLRLHYIGDNLRILQNDNIIVYALNESFYYRNTFSELTKKESDECKLIMLKLIQHCLKRNIKLVYQDYTGYDTTYLYVDLFSHFNKNDLLDNIIFDVTESDGGCYINLSRDNLIIKENKIIQNKYSRLTKISCPDRFIKERIQSVIYPLSFNFIKLKEDNSFTIIDEEMVNYMCHVYEINDDNIIEKHNKIIKTILFDVARVKEIDYNEIEGILTQIDNRNVFIGLLQILFYT
jgi:hypothetical protein